LRVQAGDPIDGGMNTILSRLQLTVVAGAVAMALAAGAQARGQSERDGDYPPPPVYAQRDDDRAGRNRGRGDDARPYVPLESIIAQIQARTPGRLVGVRGPNGQGMYRIIWETPDGRVITFVVDGRTGQVLR
jgi:uncharacterized membrane protein YkoI